MRLRRDRPSLWHSVSTVLTRPSTPRSITPLNLYKAVRQQT
jgi:hypothetical protein